MISSGEREGPKHRKDPPILPEGALSAPSIKGNIPYYFSQNEHSAKARGTMLGRIRPYWMKVMASEQRINWLKNMVRKRLLVRDIDSFFRS